MMITRTLSLQRDIIKCNVRNIIARFNKRNVDEQITFFKYNSTIFPYTRAKRVNEQCIFPSVIFFNEIYVYSIDKNSIVTQKSEEIRDF